VIAAKPCDREQELETDLLARSTAKLNATDPSCPSDREHPIECSAIPREQKPRFNTLCSRGFLVAQGNQQRALRVGGLGPTTLRCVETKLKCTQPTWIERKLLPNSRERAAQQSDRDDAKREARVELYDGAQFDPTGFHLERKRVDPTGPLVARSDRRLGNRDGRLAQGFVVWIARSHAPLAVDKAAMSAVEPGVLDEQFGGSEQHEFAIGADPELRAQIAGSFEPGLQHRTTRFRQAREAAARLGDAACAARNATSATGAKAWLEGKAARGPGRPAGNLLFDLPNRAAGLAQRFRLEYRNAGFEAGRQQPFCDGSAMRKRFIMYFPNHIRSRTQ